MNIDLSKLCADFLRSKYPGLKASHARELVAAFFGYKSHASLLAESAYKIGDLDQADIIIPAVPLINKRRERLAELVGSVVDSLKIARELVAFLEEKECITGKVWLAESLPEFVMYEWLPENVALDNELAEEIASTNAIFEEEYYETAEVEEKSDQMTITVKGTFIGETHPDKMFSGDEIDFVMTIELDRTAGRIGFMEPDIETHGSKRDYRDFEDDDFDDAPVSPSPAQPILPAISYGPIRVVQNGKVVDELVSIPGIGDHTGWRPHSLQNFSIEMDVLRRKNIEQRAFAGLTCITRFPELNNYQSRYNASYDLQPGVNRETVRLDIFSLPMNFEKFWDTYMEIEFNWGSGPLAIYRIPVKIGNKVPIF